MYVDGCVRSQKRQKLKRKGIFQNEKTSEIVQRLQKQTTPPAIIQLILTAEMSRKF